MSRGNIEDGLLDLTLGIDPNRLESATRWADDAYASCNVCPENCGVDRHAGQLGKCGLDAGARVYKEYLHFGEEAVLTPSHTVFLSGCNFRCAFCSDMAPVKTPAAHGMTLNPEALATRIALRREQGATNVNFVGGLPDVNLLFILKTLEHCPNDTHVVFNTNLWTTQDAVDKLRGIVGTWLVDVKFGSDRCARKLAGIENYMKHMTTLLPEVTHDANVLIRHLIMPGHLQCCTRPTLTWLSEELPSVPLNLMTGYMPFGLAKTRGPMGRATTEPEIEEALGLADALGLRYMINGR